MITSSRSSSARGRVAHPVDGLVNARFLFDVGVGAGDIGFGLIIIVVADEIFHRIVGEEALHLAIQLRGEDLVGRQNQRRALSRLNDLRHGEGLARAGDAQQHLRVVPALMPCTRSAMAVGWSPDGV
jgi:hypothetical protein